MKWLLLCLCACEVAIEKPVEELKLEPGQVRLYKAVGAGRHIRAWEKYPCWLSVEFRGRTYECWQICETDSRPPPVCP